MRTITIREQYLINGFVSERTATHIMTDVRGLETLCEISFDKLHNDNNEVVGNSVTTGTGQLPITCSACSLIWHDAYNFKQTDFDISPEKGRFEETPLTEITIGKEAKTE